MERHLPQGYLQTQRLQIAYPSGWRPFGQPGTETFKGMELDSAPEEVQISIES